MKQNNNIAVQSFARKTTEYLNNLLHCFDDEVIKKIESLAEDLHGAWLKHNSVYICGNGGSAANSLHIANDLHYGIGVTQNTNTIPGLNVEALPANTAIMTCLANDTGYENIFSNQLINKAKENDVLLVLSGSGNSPNIIKALEMGNKLRLKTHAILAFDGGACKELAQNSIHINVSDMQIAEDTQLIIGHLCMQWLNKHQLTSDHLKNA